MEYTLTALENGNLRLLPEGGLPRLEAAFKQGAAYGMLDLLQHGLPIGSDALLTWLREQTLLHVMQYLKLLRQGTADDEARAALVPTQQDSADLLEEMPPLHAGSVCSGDIIRWFSGLWDALRHRTAQQGARTVEEWLSRLGEGWQQLGTLCFHLAENAGENATVAPFAFLATCVHRAGNDGTPRHIPLGLAARQCGEDTAALADLLRPLQRAAAGSDFLQQLINSGQIYAPCAWTARQAHAYLENLPEVEAAGIEPRMVNLWKSLPPRAELQVQLEQSGDSRPNRAPSLQINSLLRFFPRIVLGNDALTDEELEELLRSEDGLVRFRGEWVRVDAEKLRHLLESWRQAARMSAAGIPLLAGLRWLLGKHPQRLPNLPPPEDSVAAVPGKGLEEALQRLSRPSTPPQISPQLDKILRPYQKEGVRFLCGTTEKGFGACLADDMGLGKTLQVIAWLTHLHHTGELNHTAALVVAPASLLTNWQEEISRFAPHLNCKLLHPDTLSTAETETLRRAPAKLLQDGTHVALTTYGMATRMAELLAPTPLPALVLDEAQAIKNAGSQRTRAIMQLQAERRIAITGTPVENNLSELRSLFEFLIPGLLGGESEFNAFIRQCGTDYAPLRKLIRPFTLRRRKTDPDLLPDLPPKTEQAAWCNLTPEQTRLYAAEVDHLRAVMAEPDPQTRLTLVLPVLGRLKQICNHPAQYRGESYYDPMQSGKMQRLAHLARSIAAAGEACLVFTQYRTIIPALQDMLSSIFEHPGLVLHGGTPLKERQDCVNAFNTPGGPPFMILSLKAAGTGLTLTRARHVIHFDRWWNPAVENQASDRAHRIGQQQNVLIHPLICRGTIEENIHHMLTRKRELADSLLGSGLENLLDELKLEDLL